jgi:PAS domain-containing protein
LSYARWAKYGKTANSPSPGRRYGSEATEQALRKSEERWRSVFENSAIGVALTDLNGRFLATNPTYQKMLGYTGGGIPNGFLSRDYS